MVIVTSSFSKTSFSNCIPHTLKHRAGVFKFLRFEERFRTAPFRDGVQCSVDHRPNLRKKRCVVKFLQRSADGALVSVASHVYIAFVNVSQIEVDLI